MAIKLCRILNISKNPMAYYFTNFSMLGLIVVLGVSLLNKFQEKHPITRLKLLGQFDYISFKELESNFIDILNTNLWSINVNKVKDLAYANPWVNFVFVKKQWPDLLQVEIIQHKPIAWWNDKCFLTATGKILYSTKGNNDTVNNLNLPKFYGPTGKESWLINVYLVLLENLTPLGLDISKIKFTENQGICVILGNDVNLKLGTFDLPDRIARFVVAYKKKLRTIISDISYIDLRYNNGVAVFLKPIGSFTGSGEQYVEE